MAQKNETTLSIGKGRDAIEIIEVEITVGIGGLFTASAMYDNQTMISRSSPEKRFALSSLRSRINAYKKNKIQARAEKAKLAAWNAGLPFSRGGV